MDPKQPDKKKHGKRYVLVAGVLGMLLLLPCVGCTTPTPTATPNAEATELAMAQALEATLTALAPTSTKTPEATETAEPTMTPEPTWTPTLTATPRPTFTATPVPTATGVPTATALPTLTRLRWLQELLRQTKISEDATQSMVVLFRSPMLGDATWNALLDAQMVSLREADAALREIVPPEECREAHAMLLSSSGGGLLALEYTLKGFRQDDPGLLEQGAEYTASAAAKHNLFLVMLKATRP